MNFPGFVRHPLGNEWMVRKTTPVRTTLATTNTTMMLKTASVLPGAVTKNGTCAVAAGFGEPIKTPPHRLAVQSGVTVRMVLI
jgi:hypothetical protein